MIWEHKFEIIRFDASDSKMSVDIFIPDYSLAFEYQGEQHFKSIEHWGGEEELSNIKKRDQEKRKKLTANGINLIEIDYNWDGRRDSIEAKLLGWAEFHAHDTFENVLGNQKILSCSEVRNLSASWEMRFVQLQKFKAAYGHCNVLENEDNSPLSKWLQSQFKAKKQEILNPSRIRRLEEIGVIWQDIGTYVGWEKQFQNLEAYKEKYGHCDVSQYDTEFSGLGRWVLKQRVLYNKRQLEQWRIEQLESVGFCWEPRGEKWDQRIQDLKSFKIKYGHCNVPAKWEENPDLGTWVFNLRRAQKLKKKGTLTPERVKELNALGFVWDMLESTWQKFLEELKEFKKINGHCRVPKEKKSPSPLGRWLDRQGQAFKRGKLATERQEKLNSVCKNWL